MSYEQPFRPPPFRHTPYRPWPRPTAPVRRNPHPGTLPACAPAPGHCYGSHNGDDGGRGETSFYRAVAPTGTGDSALILNSEFLILNWTHTFSAKEKDSETGLSYFGARYYSSDLSIWLSVDPMSDKYPSFSPYVYCANNPVKLVDPNGEAIDPTSQDEWNCNKQQITSTIMNRLFQLVTNTQENRSYTNKSIMSLCNTLNVMNQMEQDPVWTFALSSLGGKTSGFTKLTRDPDHDMAYLFKIGYVDMANFVHEITHCGQFLNGKIGFQETNDGFVAYVDIYDELDAYKSQYYCNQNSLPRNNYPVLTVAWLYNIKNDDGDYPYRKDGRISYDGFATKEIMKAAYPKIAKEFDNMRGYLFHQGGVIFNIVFN